MRVAFFGTCDFAVPALQALVKSRHDVARVVAAPPKPSGRGRKLTPSPVEQEARALDLQVSTPANPNDPAFVTELASLRPDIAVLAAYGYILKPPLLAAPRLGFLNIHPSLLPRFRGAAPIQRALMSGEPETGVTVIALSEQIDAGDILEQVVVPVDPDETAGELSRRLSTLGARLILDAMARLQEGRANRTPQAPGLATRASKIAKSERPVDWREPASHVHNHIRALSPEPGAVTGFRGRRVVLLRSRLHAATDGGEPGRLLVLHAGLVVATGSGAVEITELKPEGSRAQTGTSFRNGHRLVEGDRFAAA
ncbi:MAG TPA: methionyl-tRNA formyltransferase [bacterium]|nr:methionyl-tRNA formyltransferase [bacterium]